MSKAIKTNEITIEAKATLKKRTIFALIMLAIFIPCLVLGGWFYLALIILIIGASTYEIATAPSHKLSWFVWAVTFIVMYSLIFWIMLKTNFQDNWQHFDINTSFTEINLSPIALAVMIGLYLFVVIVKNKEFRLVDACYLIAMTLLLALGFQAALAVRYLPFERFLKDCGENYINQASFKYGQSMFLMIYLLIAIFFNDIGAYLIGMLFGKHKMAPRVSPKKTWEGFAGGVTFSFLLSVTFGLTVAHCGLPMLPKYLTIDKWYWIVLISAILPLIGVLGDLSFSAIKRQFGKKDYSNLLGPHGGVLDRIDSTLFGALALVILIIFITNGWSFLQ
ncbi:MAG: phosphatidate cytidylyltransferase [Bacilli bacterium]|nr:phosphatidate cytidylyltransferase [Bacilli bacterium]